MKAPFQFQPSLQELTSFNAPGSEVESAHHASPPCPIVQYHSLVVSCIIRPSSASYDPRAARRLARALEMQRLRRPVATMKTTQKTTTTPASRAAQFFFLFMMRWYAASRASTEMAAMLDCRRVELAYVQNRSSLPNRSIVREQFQLKIDLVGDQATLWIGISPEVSPRDPRESRRDFALLIKSRRKSHSLNPTCV
jgi:hypothetical protein